MIEVTNLGKVSGRSNMFVFEGYDFNKEAREANFRYRFDDGRPFIERVQFSQIGEYDPHLLDKALFLAFVIIGTSYYKSFPSTEVRFETGTLDEWQAGFFSIIYQEGLSQFAFENHLTRGDLAQFAATSSELSDPISYQGRGTLVLESGGKDSLLTASLLEESDQPFTPWYISNSNYHPAVLDELGSPLFVARRLIDLEALHQARSDGGLNGHVPVTYIVQSIAVLQAILTGNNQILVSIAHEGQEPHATIGDLPVTHQWSKTWEAEQAFADYVRRYISPDIQIGSPLRRFSELKVAELFVQHAWADYGHRFSSCNVANYKQGSDNRELHWCGECPKCANAYLLFAPFVDAEELQSLFAGLDLFEKPLLAETFKGLLGIDGVMKPFECVGEIDELRYAYHKAQAKAGYGKLPFDVPAASFDYQAEYPSQDWSDLLPVVQ